MKRYAMALDLKDDAVLIAEYEAHHRSIWPEILESIRGSGIIQMEIYRIGPRLFMTIDATDDFLFELKAAHDAANEKVQEWEQLMWTYQVGLPMAREGEKWIVMKKIFDLQES